MIKQYTMQDFDDFMDTCGGAVLKSFEEAEDEQLNMLKAIQPELARELWKSGCFQQFAFDELDLPEEDLVRVQFASGQRAFMKPVNRIVPIGIATLNAYIDGVDPNPGRELADEVNDQIFGVQEEE